MGKYNKDIHIRVTKGQYRFIKNHLGDFSSFVRDKIDEKKAHYERFKDVMS